MTLQTHYDLSVTYLDNRAVLEAIIPFDGDGNSTSRLNPVLEQE